MAINQTVAAPAGAARTVGWAAAPAVGAMGPALLEPRPERVGFLVLR
jgi:hypothetical protein